jgi:electron transfer flavoprotein alpha subunit
MSVLVYFKANLGLSKVASEIVTYAKKLSDDVIVLTNGEADASVLAQYGKYGATKVLWESNTSTSDNQVLSKLIGSVAQQINAKTIVFAHDNISKAVAPRLSVKLQAGLVSGAIDLPNSEGLIKVNVFSGKAQGFVKVATEKKIISLLPNSIQPEISGNDCPVETLSLDLGSSAVKVLTTKKPEGEIPLPEAEIVVSGGRGLKGPENWGIVEDLAKSLGAATACSRPVADIGWRPHHEHVGQTGVAIRPNLYIAAGISGAIQHLAGVNGSKVMVVINTDPEAPFFKAADYGVVGDVFEVLPRLTEAIEKFKASSN